MVQTIPRYILAARFVAWTGFVAITAFTVVPASFRPVTGVGSNFEHVTVFFGVFAAFSVGYELSAARLVLFALLFCGGIELIQIPLPTRHARVSDFIVDFAASSLAIGITLMGKKLLGVNLKKGTAQ
jgi:VanZ family protein